MEQFEISKDIEFKIDEVLVEHVSIDSDTKILLNVGCGTKLPPYRAEGYAHTVFKYIKRAFPDNMIILTVDRTVESIGITFVDE